MGREGEEKYRGVLQGDSNTGDIETGRRFCHFLGGVVYNDRKVT